MKGSRFSEIQIISILKETEAGLLVKDVCRKHGISDATYYKWKSKLLMLLLSVIPVGVSGNASKLCTDLVSHGIVSGFTAFIAVCDSTRNAGPRDGCQSELNNHYLYHSSRTRHGRQTS